VNLARCLSVLIVEDEADIRELVASALEAEGFQVYQADTGVRALELLKEVPHPSLILADLMMPVMDGWELIRALSQDDRLATLPVVAVSRSRSTSTSSSRSWRKYACAAHDHARDALLSLCNHAPAAASFLRYRRMSNLAAQSTLGALRGRIQAKPEYPHEPHPGEPHAPPNPASPPIPYPGHHPTPGLPPDPSPIQPGPREIPLEDPPPEEPPRRDPPEPHQPGEPPPIIDVPPGPDANPIDPRVF
jgi:CheY-like chemotaxis protein